MAIKVPNVGERQLLDRMTGAVGANFYICLYKAAHTPADGDTKATYTAIEADYTGYGRLSCGFNPAETNGDGRAESLADLNRVFENAGGGSPTVGNTVHGYFVLDNSDGPLLWAEEFGMPVPMNEGSPSLTITLRLTLHSFN